MYRFDELITHSILRSPNIVVGYGDHRPVGVWRDVDDAAGFSSSHSDFMAVTRKVWVENRLFARLHI